MTVDLWVFDWSGTISDDRASCLHGINHVFKHYNHPAITWEELKRNYSADIVAFYRKWGIEATRENFYKIFREEFDRNPHKPTAIPSAPEAVKMLTEIAPVAIFSSHPTELLKQEIAEYWLKDVISHTYGYVDKAQTRELEELLQRAGARPRNTVYVGDTHVDITLAHRVGTKSVAIVHERSYQTLEGVKAFNPAPHAIISSLNELPGTLPKLDLASSPSLRKPYLSNG